MKVNYSLLYASSLTLAVMGATPAQAGWLDFLSNSTEEAAETMQQGSETLNKVDQTLQAGEAATQAVPTTQSELTGILMQQTGVTQAQAEGGAGAMFQVAKQRMTNEAFGQLTQAVPGMDTYLAAAPQVTTNPVGGLAGGLLGAADSATGGAIGSATSLLSAFKQLNLSQDMVTQFTPVLVDYVKQQGSPQLSAVLQAALTGSAN